MVDVPPKVYRSPEELRAMNSDDRRAYVTEYLAGASHEESVFMANAIRLALSADHNERARADRPCCYDTLLKQTYLSEAG